VKRTGVSASVSSAFTLSLASLHGKIGTLMSTGAALRSGSKSGMNMKSIVEVSPTAFKLRLVLKCRTGLPVSFASGMGRVAEAGRRGALEPRAGLSEVRREEKVAGPVMESWRVVVLEVEVRARRARGVMRAVDIVVVVRWRCGGMNEKKRRDGK
jgi:hypothetical protein